MWQMSGTRLLRRRTPHRKRREASTLTVSKQFGSIILTHFCILAESGVSRASYKSRVNEEMKKFQEKAQSEWDASTVNTETKRLSTEERMARRIAKEVLRDNKKLGNVHSDASLQKLLEREAKKQLEADN